MFATLRYFWKSNLATAAATAAATATLTGALVVGDSVRSSLANLSLDRLGRIDYALTSERFFGERLGAFTDKAGTAPAILLLGGTESGRQDERRRAASVQIIGVDERFWVMFDDVEEASRALAQCAGPFPPVVLNTSLAHELDVAAGDELLLTFERIGHAPRESLFGRKETEDVVELMRVRVAAVLPTAGAGHFTLQSHQGSGYLVYLPLRELQRALECRGRVNALLVTAPWAMGAKGAVLEHLQASFDRAVSLQDLQLELAARRLEGGTSFVELSSERFVLTEHTQAAALAAAEQVGTQVLSINTYLATALTSRDGRTVPYSTITALDVAAIRDRPSLFGTLLTRDGGPLPTLRPESILLNEWATDDLAIGIGDTLSLSYYAVEPREELVSKKAAMRVAGVVKLESLAADPSLTPSYPGLQEADDMSSWSPPFPVDFTRIRERDEDYWDTYGATPKAFISQASGLRLWRNRHGTATTMRFTVAPGRTPAEVARSLEEALLHQLSPTELGLRFHPVKENALTASRGATDFSALFAGFSMFLIAAAVLLTGLLFRLGMESRVRELGALVALGFNQSRVRRRYMSEGAVVAVAGCAVGVVGAVAYGWLMMAGLRTWWKPAVSTTALSLSVEPVTLLAGGLASLAIVVAVIERTLRRLLESSPRVLMAGGAPPAMARPSPLRRLAPAVSAVLAAATLIAAAGSSDAQTTAALFFASGALFLVAGLCAFSSWLSRQPSASGSRAWLPISTGNSRRHPARSMLCVALIAAASFVIVAAGVHRRIGSQPAGMTMSDTANGGYQLMAQASIPVYIDLASKAVRAEFDIGDSSGTLMQIASFRRRAGEDASCLNLYRPREPTLLGAPPDFVARGGFRFKQAIDRTEANPWQLLYRDLGPGVIPAIGDYNSVLWILHLGLGDDLILRNERGEEVRARFVALLDGSFFQSEIILSERDFLHHFPTANGFGFFTIQTAPEVAAEIGELFESRLWRHGFDAKETSEEIARFAKVENTYLATFQILGGLGLLLGTLGLGLVILRNALERTGELAAMRAVGFAQAQLARMLLAESTFLLFAGVIIGAGAALVTAVPQLAARDSDTIPFVSLSATLVLVIAVGIAASASAAAVALRAPLIPALKAE